MSQKQVIKSTDELVAIFNKCHNILRNNEGIVGLKALTEFSDLLFLKLLEPMIDSEEIKLPKYCKFSEFSKMPEEEMYEHIKNKVWQQLWKLIPDVYHGNYLDIKYPHTLKEIITVLDSVDFDHTATDIKGSAYEHFISRELVGKTLGQFFTPRLVVNEMIKYVNPKINKDGTSETIYDPACGTGGFLVQAFNHLKVQKGVNLKWIQKNAVHGSEINSDTVRICKLNMLCAGDGKSNIVKRDSLRYCPEETFDIVLANPPFGIKGIKFDMLGVKYPIESNTAEFLFLENIVKVLKKGGRAAVIIPEGVLFKGGIGSKLREWLLKEVKLEKVVSLSSGTFDYAGVKTAILYFTKSEKTLEEGKFSTDKVEFTTYGEKDSITVSLKDLSKNEYNLIKSAYEKKTSVVNTKKNVLNLKEIVDIKGGRKETQDAKTNGKYPFFICAEKPVKIDIADYNEEAVLIAGTGNLYIHYYNGEFNARQKVHILTVKKEFKENVLAKWLFYKLQENIVYFKERQRGATLKNINQEEVLSFPLEIPDKKDQEKFIEKMDFIYEQLNKSKVVVVVENIQKEIDLIVMSLFEDNSNKVQIEELFNVEKGEYLTKQIKEGKYPVIGQGSIARTSDKFSKDGEIIVVGTHEPIGQSNYFKGKCATLMNTAVLTKKAGFDIDSIELYAIYFNIKRNKLFEGEGAVHEFLKTSTLKNTLIKKLTNEEVESCLVKIKAKQQIVDLIKKDLMNNDN